LPIILNDCKVPVENLLASWQGARHRLQHPEHWTLQTGRDVRGGRGFRSRVPWHMPSSASIWKDDRRLRAGPGKIANMATLIYVGESLVYRTVGMMDTLLSE